MIIGVLLIKLPSSYLSMGVDIFKIIWFLSLNLLNRDFLNIQYDLFIVLVESSLIKYIILFIYL